ncbi:MAG: response regulator [Pyrinomonadaceae bacterium]
MARILVVDDDDSIRDTIYELLETDHFCHAAETAERALQFLATETYDVVLTDISMPGMSGLELLGYIRQHQPQTPVIIISGITDQEHAQGMIRMGAFNYILKPFKLETIEATVTQAIEHRQQLLKK